MTSSAVLSTLHHITEVKLAKLARQQATFDKGKKSLLEAVNKESQPIEKVRILLEGLKNRCGDQLPLEYINVERFLFQAKHDSSISASMLGEWKLQLEQELDWQQEKYRYTSLFGHLVTEWIRNPDQPAQGVLHGPNRGSGRDTAEPSFETVGREEMHEQRKEWESYAFEERRTDSKMIEAYLDGLFKSTLTSNSHISTGNLDDHVRPTSASKSTKKTPLEILRERVSKFDDIGLQRFDEQKVRICIDGILSSDLFAGDKRRALVDLKKEDAVLAEMADVLNADLTALDGWEWDPLPLRLNMRKQINGKYRVYMDEELHQAIFIHWIGALWAGFLKRTFINFFNSGAWLHTPYQSLSKKDLRRREHFLGTSANSRTYSIRSERRKTYLKDYFMTQLPSKVTEGGRDYGDDEEDSSQGDDDKTKSPLAIKQSLLSLVTTESLINTHLYGKFTVVQSDFKWFGPSLPHSTIFSVLEYFHVSKKWLKFLKKFLQTPLAFSQDGPDAEARPRLCGIPMAHLLADAMGECVLFVLDFAVNQRTMGSNLYRFHDDLWFWGQPDSCVDAWKAMTEFSRVMGLSLNEEKTGSCQIALNSKSSAIPRGLPKGSVRWGFLTLSSTSGHWTIDQADIKKHTQELKRQLSVCRSVFAYVQAYNAYMARFFLNNLPQPRVCLGREHLDLVIATMDSIQKDLFDGYGSASGNVAGHLKKMIEERFGVRDIPDGFIFFPPELGGLGVKSPLIPYLAKCDSSGDPEDVIQAAYDQEEEEYEKARAKYEMGEISRSNSFSERMADDEPFMSLEEFMGFREERSRWLLTTAYRVLLEEVEAPHFRTTKTMQQALHNVDYNQGYPNILWIIELYGREILKRFGSLGIGDKELLPIALLDMLKSEKVRWQG